MKNLTGLMISCVRECAEISGVNADQDVKYILERVEHEGLSFLTITLPKFGADLEIGLDRGFVDSNLFTGFSWKGGLPKFLRGFLCRVFHPRTGVLHAKPNVEAVRFVRQICHLLKKVELPCTPERERAAIVRYLSTETELRSREDGHEWTEDDYLRFSRMAVLVFGSVLSVVDQMVYNGEILPNHGSGAVADKMKGNQKWHLPNWTDRLESIFPYVDFGLPNHRYWEMIPEYHTLEQELPVKVTLVPKTLKTPRVIAMEPTHMQYMQQGLLHALVDACESPDKGTTFVGFNHQEPNQLLAREGSITGSLATIDLSDASDRVLNSLVMNGLVRRFPWLRESLDATRSRRSRLPQKFGGDVIELRKFASMGSATCFPIEALVFATIVFLGIEKQIGRTLTRKDISSYVGSVRVYGDDIVVPTVHATHVTEELAFWGLAVNHSKSFWNGQFRESCGGDYFAGEWVTPIRCKTDVPRTWDDVDRFQAWIALSNNLHFAGYWKTASYAAKAVQDVYGKLAIVSEESSAVGLVSFCGVPPSQREHPTLHKPLVRAHVVKTRTPKSSISGVAALHKCLRFDWSDPVDKMHLLQSGRPVDVVVRRQWVSAV